MKFEDLQKANEKISTITLERKDKKTGKVSKKEYAEVHQRVKAFRMLYPDGCIKTEMLSNENGVCVFKAEVYSSYKIDETKYIMEAYLLSTGYAYEKESNGFINATSYIENAETGSVGRALGFLGIGIDTSIASAEEVLNAEINEPLERKYAEALSKELGKHGKKASDLAALQGMKGWSELTIDRFQAAMKELGAE